jgi:hypothetical protein
MAGFPIKAPGSTTVWRTRSKTAKDARLVEFLYRFGGISVYVCSQYPNGLTEAQYSRLLRESPRARKFHWRHRTREPRVYARGKVRHPDHKTIVLPLWHRVAVSGEVQSRNVAFLD